MNLLIRLAALATALLTTTTTVLAHSDKREKRPQSFADAVIPMTSEEWRREPNFRHRV